MLCLLAFAALTSTLAAAAAVPSGNHQRRWPKDPANDAPHYPFPSNSSSSPPQGTGTSTDTGASTGTAARKAFTASSLASAPAVTTWISTEAGTSISLEEPFTASGLTSSPAVTGIVTEPVIASTTGAEMRMREGAMTGVITTTATTTVPMILQVSTSVQIVTSTTVRSTVEPKGERRMSAAVVSGLEPSTTSSTLPLSASSSTLASSASSPASYSSFGPSVAAATAVSTAPRTAFVSTSSGTTTSSSEDAKGSAEGIEMRQDSDAGHALRRTSEDDVYQYVPAGNDTAEHQLEPRHSHSTTYCAAVLTADNFPELTIQNACEYVEMKLEADGNKHGERPHCYKNRAGHLVYVFNEEKESVQKILQTLQGRFKWSLFLACGVQPTTSSTSPSTPIVEPGLGQRDNLVTDTLPTDLRSPDHHSTQSQEQPDRHLVHCAAVISLADFDAATQLHNSKMCDDIRKAVMKDAKPQKHEPHCFENEMPKHPGLVYWYEQETLEGQKISNVIGSKHKNAWFGACKVPPARAVDPMHSQGKRQEITDVKRDGLEEGAQNDLDSDEIFAAPPGKPRVAAQTRDTGDEVYKYVPAGGNDAESKLRGRGLDLHIYHCAVVIPETNVNGLPQGATIHDACKSIKKNVKKAKAKLHKDDHCVSNMVGDLVYMFKARAKNMPLVFDTLTKNHPNLNTTACELQPATPPVSAASQDSDTLSDLADEPKHSIFKSTGAEDTVHGLEKKHCAAVIPWNQLSVGLGRAPPPKKLCKAIKKAIKKGHAKVPDDEVHCFSNHIRAEGEHVKASMVYWFKFKEKKHVQKVVDVLAQKWDGAWFGACEVQPSVKTGMESGKVKDQGISGSPGQNDDVEGGTSSGGEAGSTDGMEGSIVDKEAHEPRSVLRTRHIDHCHVHIPASDVHTEKSTAKLCANLRANVMKSEGLLPGVEWCSRASDNGLNYTFHAENSDTRFMLGNINAAYPHAQWNDCVRDGIIGPAPPGAWPDKRAVISSYVAGDSIEGGPDNKPGPVQSHSATKRLAIKLQRSQVARSKQKRTARGLGSTKAPTSKTRWSESQLQARRERPTGASKRCRLMIPKITKGWDARRRCTTLLKKVIKGNLHGLPDGAQCDETTFPYDVLMQWPLSAGRLSPYDPAVGRTVLQRIAKSYPLMNFAECPVKFKKPPTSACATALQNSSSPSTSSQPAPFFYGTTTQTYTSQSVGFGSSPISQSTHGSCSIGINGGKIHADLVCKKAKGVIAAMRLVDFDMSTIKCREIGRNRALFTTTETNGPALHTPVLQSCNKLTEQSRLFQRDTVSTERQSFTAEKNVGEKREPTLISAVRDYSAKSFSLAARSHRDKPKVQSCFVKRKCKKNGDQSFCTLYFDITVGEPFENGEGCKNIQDALKAAVSELGALQSYSCKDDGHGGTKLLLQVQVGPFPEDLINGPQIFRLPGIINNALAPLYSNVAGGFNRNIPGDSYDQRDLSPPDSAGQNIAKPPREIEGRGVWQQPSATRRMLASAPEGQASDPLPLLPNFTASCSVVYLDSKHGEWWSYNLQIGVVYADGKGCDNTKKALTEKIPGTQWNSVSCLASPDGMTRLAFLAPYTTTTNSTVNSVLSGEYTEVGQGIHCDPYSTDNIPVKDTIECYIDYDYSQPFRHQPIFVTYRVGKTYDATVCDNIKAAFQAGGLLLDSGDDYNCAPIYAGGQNIWTAIQFSAKYSKKFVKALNKVTEQEYATATVAAGKACPEPPHHKFRRSEQTAEVQSGKWSREADRAAKSVRSAEDLAPFADMVDGSHVAANEHIEKRGIRMHTQSCTKALWLGELYEQWKSTITVGEPYKHGDGCSNIIGAMQTGLDGALTSMSCDPAEDDNTLLEVRTTHDTKSSSKINAVLTQQYPMVEGGFNCENDSPGSKRTVREEDPGFIDASGNIERALLDVKRDALPVNNTFPVKDTLECEIDYMRGGQDQITPVRIWWHVGKPFKQDGCDNIKNSFSDHLQGKVTEWSCVPMSIMGDDDNNAGTAISLFTSWRADLVSVLNGVRDAEYPELSVAEGRECQDAPSNKEKRTITLAETGTAGLVMPSIKRQAAAAPIRNTIPVKDTIECEINYIQGSQDESTPVRVWYHVGKPYESGGCNDILEAFQNATHGQITRWACEPMKVMGSDDSNMGTFISFYAMWTANFVDVMNGVTAVVYKTATVADGRACNQPPPSTQKRSGEEDLASWNTISRELLDPGRDYTDTPATIVRNGGSKVARDQFNPNPSTIDPGTQSCRANSPQSMGGTPALQIIQYNIVIGQDYNKGSSCNPIKAALLRELPNDSYLSSNNKWSCNPTYNYGPDGLPYFHKDGITYPPTYISLSFETSNSTKAMDSVNMALNSTFGFGANTCHPTPPGSVGDISM